MWLERSELTDDPLVLVISQVTDTNTITSRLVMEFITIGVK